jgi:hypothetical protein
MAGLQERSGRYRVSFRYHGKQHSLTLDAKVLRMRSVGSGLGHLCESQGSR